ncbi:MAG TPA: sigma-70 family RNA polymerase sigma factor [Candidatus Paceibacterota bacterium]|nr:sigma-70 family RNA polymerase sigma factor [Verrucomicrobiota bacterium]HRY49987.1 sigma-70 family RNA polymerase sigma factor [Candidatus Paceibacterota bacterium]
MADCSGLIERYCRAANRAEAEDAARELMHIVGPFVKRYIWRRIPEEAQDVLQTTWMYFFKRLHTVRDRTEDGLRRFAKAIAKRKVDDALRKMGKQGKLGKRKAESRLSAEDVEKEADRYSHECWAANKPSDTALEAMELLQICRPEWRVPIVLRCVEEWEYQEIANALGLTVGGVKMRIMRGLDWLEKRLEGISKVPRNQWTLHEKEEVS